MYTFTYFVKKYLPNFTNPVSDIHNLPTSLVRHPPPPPMHTKDKSHTPYKNISMPHGISVRTGLEMMFTSLAKQAKSPTIYLILSPERLPPTHPSFKISFKSFPNSQYFSGMFENGIGCQF